MNPFPLIAWEYGPIAFGPLSVAITSFTKPPVDSASLPCISRSSRIARPEVRRDSFVVEPDPKKLGKILTAGLLECGAESIIAGLLPSQQSDHVFQPAAHGDFSASILKSDKEKRSFREGDAPLWGWIGQHGHAERRFGRLAAEFVVFVQIFR